MLHYIRLESLPGQTHIHMCCEYGLWSYVSYLAQALMFHTLLRKEHLTQQSSWMLLMELHAYFVYLNII